MPSLLAIWRGLKKGSKATQRQTINRPAYETMRISAPEPKFAQSLMESVRERALMTRTGKREIKANTTAASR